MEGIRAALVDGVDFGSVRTKRGMSRPSLRKPGAEKICGMLGLSVLYPTLHEYERAALEGKEIKYIVLRCELVNSQKALVAVGIGARNVSQDYGDLNKSLKMAAKSAHVDAVLRCAGLSEVFTQDIEDMIARGETDPQAMSPAPVDITPRQAQSAALVDDTPTGEFVPAEPGAGEIPDNKPGYTYNGQSGLVGGQTKAHKALEAALRDAGLATHRERVKNYCKNKYGIGHFPELTIAQARELRRAFPGIKEKIERQEREAKEKSAAQAQLREIMRLFEILEEKGIQEYDRCMEYYGVKNPTEIADEKTRKSLIKHLRSTAKIMDVDVDANWHEPPGLAELKEKARQIRECAERADNGEQRREELEEAAKIEQQIADLVYQAEQNANAHRYN
jgi:hypothetical protein